MRWLPGESARGRYDMVGVVPVLGREDNGVGSGTATGYDLAVVFFWSIAVSIRFVLALCDFDRLRVGVRRLLCAADYGCRDE